MGPLPWVGNGGAPHSCTSRRAGRGIRQNSEQRPAARQLPGDSQGRGGFGKHAAAFPKTNVSKSWADNSSSRQLLALVGLQGGEVKAASVASHREIDPGITPVADAVENNPLSPAHSCVVGSILRLMRIIVPD